MENRKMQTEYGFPCREAKPVWLPDGSQPNRYVQFLQKFTWDGDGALSLQLSCDSRARVCLNGERIGFAFYDGTDDTSWYETFDLSAAAVRGENTLEIEVWYQGVSSNCYTAGRAYVIFAVMRGEGACAVASGAQTLCRADTAYRAGKVPTNQTGMVWYYDQTAEPQRYAPAAELTTDGRRYAPRPIARQVLSGRKRAAVCAHGYLLPGDREPFESAFLSARGKNVQLDAGADRYEIWDCGEESSGLLEIEVSSAAGCRVELGWGEHLDDLRVRSHIGSRMFQTAVTFGAGTHCFRHDFQRIGMRYLEVHLHPLNGGTAQCLYAGVRPLDYPVTERGEFYCSDRLHMQIYRTAIHTLRLCMHEHYEDCPWREQALYAMDSLNQAVCGYYCFGEYAFAAASLRMLARGMQADGFLELHTPGKEVVTIPYFTFMWVLGVRDYLRYSGDRELVRALWPSIRLAAQCRLRECRDGLCRSRQNTGAFTSGTTCCRANRSTAASCSHRALTRRIRCSSCCFWTRRPSLPKSLANAGTQPCCTAAARRRAGRAMPCSGMQRAAATARLRMKRTAHSMRKTARRASLCRRWPSCRALPGRRSASGSCRCWLRAKTTGSRVRSA